MDQAPRTDPLAALRARVARLERSAPVSAPRPAAGLGAAIDARLPWRGLPVGALHEVAGSGAEGEHAAAAARLVAGVLARLPGPVVWAFGRRDLFAPGLAAVGLHPNRVIHAEAGSPRAVLLVMEEALRQRGLAGVVGEIEGRLTLTASRRLQLAAEASAVIGFVLRRSRRHDDPALSEPSAAVTRWRVAALPSGPPLAHAPDVPGLGRARWCLDLVRCRGGEPWSWVVEACDAQGRLGLAADLADRSEAAPARRAAT